MRSFAASSLVVIALILPGIASAKPTVTLKLTGSVVTKAADGHTTLTPVEKVSLKPGDEVEYDIVASNAGDSAALRLVPMGKIPAGTSYVDGSAKSPRARAEFSLDGGKTWSATPMVTVKQPDGTTIVKKADPSLYTAVRFLTTGPVPAHGSAAYTYEVRVK
jgi:uncharacterized repeat protein (TIGR01451 family)